MVDDNPFRASPANEAQYGYADDAIVAAVTSDIDLGESTPAYQENKGWATYEPAGNGAENPYAAFPSRNAPSGATGEQSGEERLAQREKELQQREAELAKREAEVSRLQVEGKRNNPVGDKNWPYCCPVIHHDIQAEIPAAWKGPVTKAFWSYLGLAVCLVWNFISVTSYSFGTSGDMNSFFMSVIYGVAAIPIALFLWYLRLYNATIHDRAITFGWFFIMYLIHVIFCFWAAVAPPIGTIGGQMSFAGVFSTVSAFGSGVGFGILYLIGTVLWGLEALWSLLVLQQTYSQFRAGGGQGRLQAQMQTVNRAVDQAAGRV
uniref:Secretory carrier-associated membrane protein n=1 Tax=Tetraselmis sp. GSL018 TaxID=582737 RepID=A0A061S8P6_9CHLO